jgi:hypothetical protein
MNELKVRPLPAAATAGLQNRRSARDELAQLRLTNRWRHGSGRWLLAQATAGESIRVEPGVLAIYSIAEKGSPTSLMPISQAQIPCGSGLARESGGAVNINVCRADVFASKPAPTIDLRCFEH